MAFLEPKEQILDIVLTDKGRELLSKNQLNFAYYAFGDEGINYSGSLSSSNSNFTASIDSIIFRNFSFEGTQRKNQDLNSFLYTVLPGSKKVPELVFSVSPNNRLELKRHYMLEDFNNMSQISDKDNINPIDIVFRATIESPVRVTDYVIQQNVYKYISGTLHKQ